ncbi:MAG: hypothetical protein KDC43_12860 [Saprospiraceae bacterium]|nr:hypothetical protein [Saprospiraceae bacterium]
MKPLSSFSLFPVPFFLFYRYHPFMQVVRRVVTGNSREIVLLFWRRTIITPLPFYPVYFIQQQ